MLFKFANNVLSTVDAAVLIGDTTISVSIESGINNPPPDPEQGVAVLTLVDDLANPTKMEIIYYTGISGTGPYTLTGCIRGREGTTDQTWAIGDIVFQDETAECMPDTPLIHPKTIKQNAKIPDDYSALMLSPITVDTDKSLTIGTNSILVIQ